MNVTNEDVYLFCVHCAFGIEVNVHTERGVSAEYYNDTATGPICYYCDHRTTRTRPAIKRLLAESTVLMLSAKRINNAPALAFYSRQVKRCTEALSGDKPEPAPETNSGQQSLFESLLKP